MSMRQCAFLCKVLVTLKFITNSHAAELFSPGQTAQFLSKRGTNINYPKIFFPAELFVNIMLKPTAVNALHYNQTVSAMFPQPSYLGNICKTSQTVFPKPTLPVVARFVKIIPRIKGFLVLKAH
jgi:hypothetical protein